VLSADTQEKRGERERPACSSPDPSSTKTVTGPVTVIRTMEGEELFTDWIMCKAVEWPSNDNIDLVSSQSRF
jgi:hypothetical protein